MEFDNSVFFRLLKDNNFECARNYLESFVPDYLYKYYSLSDCTDDDLNNKKIDTLADNANWFDINENQNDPFDMKMAYIGDELIKQKGACEEAVEAASKVLSQIQSSFLLCSLSNATELNLPMWAHYANNHHGFCIKYKVNNRKAIHRIFYEEKRISILDSPLEFYFEAKKSSVQGYETERLKQINELLLLLINIKHESWSYEKEFRMLYPKDDSSTGKRVTNEWITPTDVYIGVNCIDNYKQKIIKICKEKLLCNVYQAHISKEDFLSFEQL